jgi:hypothetical protein
LREGEPPGELAQQELPHCDHFPEPHPRRA